MHYGEYTSFSYELNEEQLRPVNRLTVRIADIMDAKLGTVRSRIHRGRAMLREALAHRAPAEGRQRYAGPALPGPVPTGGLAAGSA